MKKNFLLVLIVICGLMATPAQHPAAAQAATWSAWLYDAEAFRLTLINATGAQEDVILPLPAGYDYVTLLQISPDGKQMAYIGVQSASELQTFLLYDHTLRAIIATYDLGVGAIAGAPQFSSNGARVAFGYTLAPEGWEIVIIDIATLTITDALRYDDPPAVGLPVSFNLVPYIQFYDGVQVAFAIVLANAGGAPEYDAYLWDTLGGGLQPTLGYVQPYADRYAPTGEIIMALEDSRLSGVSFGMVNANTLQVYDPVSQTRYPFYHDGAYTLGKPYFVNSGAYVLFARQDADYAETWQLIDRVSGLIATYPPDFAPQSVIGTAEGFLYVQDAAVYEVNLVDSSLPTELIYSFPTSAFLSLVWIGNLDGLPLFGAGGYPAWAQLLDSEAPEVSSDDLTPPPSDDPDDGALRIGGTATVNTTGGDSLNMRTAAGVSYQIRKKLARGSEVTILAGPTEANGFNWWQIRDSSGTEGWVVDFFDGTVTLLPRAYFGSDYVPNNEVAANPSMTSLLSIGGSAQVTLSNPRDVLRMRNGAGLNFRVVSLLPSGTRLQIVDGPRNADRLTWWQIRTPEGNVGWAAEIIGSERAITAQAAGTTAATATPSTDQTLIAPLLVSPLPATTINTLPRVASLRWSPVPNAQHYTLDIEACAVAECFTLQTFANLTETTSDLTVPAAGTYRWRVTAHNGSHSSASEWWLITFADMP